MMSNSQADTQNGRQKNRLKAAEIKKKHTGGKLDREELSEAKKKREEIENAEEITKQWLDLDLDNKK